MERTLSLCRHLYNAALQERRDAYKKAGRTVGFYEQKKWLPAQYTSKRGTTPLGWTCAHVDGQVPIGGGPHGTAYPTHQRLEA
ncbi:helix-turn-helix domain-containing protein, partial [Thermus scotoductus]|uniref:helix-turn-helix domain-containing protein n=1 Tax=Thermus scotoductus TaxID=37636 RepID=UPI002647EE34